MIGGKRTGAGRKRAVEGELLTTVAFGLAQRHVQAIKQWQTAHQCSSASEAVRQMLDQAADGIHSITLVSASSEFPAGTPIKIEQYAPENLPAIDPVNTVFSGGATDVESRNTPTFRPLVEADLPENLLAEPSPPPAGGESSQDWQWKRQPISRPTKESRPKRAKPKQ